MAARIIVGKTVEGALKMDLELVLVWKLFSVFTPLVVGAVNLSFYLDVMILHKEALWRRKCTYAMMYRCAFGRFKWLANVNIRTCNFVFPSFRLQMIVLTEKPKRKTYKKPERKKLRKTWKTKMGETKIP
jgi:hypothetical protein